MIHLKKYEFLDCIRECGKVIQRNAKNVKAWCRMGQSRMMLAEYKRAHEDLMHALSLDPDNKYVKRMIRLNKKKKRAYNTNQKNLYGGMFDRYNEYQKSKKPEKEKTNALRSLDEVRVNLGDIDDYDINDDESSVGSIDFDFDDMDDDTTNKAESDNEDNNNNAINSLEAIDEDD